MMLQSVIGVSRRQNFLRTRIVPANDNDVYKTNKCSFCWGSYDEDYPAVCVIPCNHVFGRPCIEETTAASAGDLCPICRVALFRPCLMVLLDAMLWNFFLCINTILMDVCKSLIRFWSGRPSWVRVAAWTLGVAADPCYMTVLAHTQAYTRAERNDCPCPWN